LSARYESRVPSGEQLKALTLPPATSTSLITVGDPPAGEAMNSSLTSFVSRSAVNATRAVVSTTYSLDNVLVTPV
jgi:hypothetical protein